MTVQTYNDSSLKRMFKEYHTWFIGTVCYSLRPTDVLNIWLELPACPYMSYRQEFMMRTYVKESDYDYIQVVDSDGRHVFHCFCFGSVTADQILASQCASCPT